MTIASTPENVDPAEAFDAFVRTNFADVWRFVRRRVDGNADADDVTADVFATAWRRRDESPPDDERRLWLFGVARLTLRNQRRAGVRRTRLHLRVVDATATTTGPVEPDDTVWRALASLDADDRELLLMRAWDGLAVNDMAVVLGISANAVSQRMAKARTRLAGALERVDPGDPAGAAVAPASLSRTDGPHNERTDRSGTGHASVDPATATTSPPEVASRPPEENDHA